MPHVRDLLLYKPEQFVAEYELASYIRDLLSIGCDKIEATTTGLLHEQPKAVVEACQRPLSILTGAAGTGKSTVTKQIVNSFQKAGLKVRVACPTGKAAKRSAEIINDPERIREGGEEVECTTIHRLLQFDHNSGGFEYNRSNKFNDFDVLIVDEYPFLGNILARDLFEALEPGQHRVVLVGDPNQLPSVDSGNIGRDLLDSPYIPSTRLNVVLRQGANSGIVQNANLVLLGKELIANDPATGVRFSDCFFTPTNSEEESLKLICKWIHEDIPNKRKFDSVRDIQVISPGKKSVIGTHNLNKELRTLLNGGTKREALGFKLGDKVINKENSKKLGVVNGDVGLVVDIEVENAGRDQYVCRVVVDFGKGVGIHGDGLVKYDQETISMLEMALSFTVHKSQGSEFPVVILPLHMSHALLLNRNMLYTGMTRPRSLLCMLGDPAALKKAIWNDRPSKRRTRLRSILNSMLSKSAA